MNFLDYSGLQRFLDRLKTIIPTKTSDIQNDSGFLDTTGVQNYMENGGGYSQSYIDTALSGKADSSHTHTKSEITDFPTLATVATSGSYNDLSDTPTIPVVNNKTLTIQKNGTTVNTFTANSASDVTANITVPTAVSELTNDSGYLTSASSLDSSKLTGTIDIARLPKGALERLVTVANQTARFALTTSDVQLGDTVKQLDTGVMYIVTDESKLSSADGYTEYTAGSATSVPWSGVTGKPSSYTPSSHTHGNVTNDGKLGTASRALITNNNNEISVSNVTATELNYLSGVTSNIQSQLGNKATSSHSHGNIANGGTLGTASRALITDSNKKITTSSVSDTELGYLSGVTSSVQTQLNGKSASNHVHGNITNDGKVGTTANLPLITGTGGVVQAGSFGNAANTFCEGNDSRLSDARTPVSHTHLTADVTDLLNSAHTWTGNNTYSKPVAIERNTDTGYFLVLKNTVAELGSTPASAASATIGYPDKNNDQLGYMGMFYDTDGSNHFRLFVRNKYASGAPSTSGTTDYATFQLKINADQSKEGILRASFRPYENNTYDLGSSSYQWNNLYAKNYFYNGTQWGLDRANTWTAQNSFNSDLNLNYASTDVDDIVNSVAGSATLDNFVHMTGNETVNGIKSFPDGVIANVTGSATSATQDGSGNVISTTYGKLGAANEWSGLNTFSGNIRLLSDFTLGVIPQSIKSSSVAFRNSTEASQDIRFIMDTAGETYTSFRACNKFTSGALSPTGSVNISEFKIGVSSDGNKYIYANGLWQNSITPYSTNTYNLGTSTNKWKSFNGINPGELSLPNMGTTASQTIDITDWYIPDPDDPTYPDENAKKIDDSVEHTIEGSSHVGAGYIHIAIPNVSGNYVYARQYALGTNMCDGRIADGLAFDAFPNILFTFPIVNSLKVRIKAKTAVVRFFPCLGNV